MFDYEEPAAKNSPDYTGLIVLAIVSPVFFLSIYLGNAELGFNIMLVLGVAMIAVRLRWKLRKHVWFWATIVIILIVHIPLVFFIRRPPSNVPGIFYTVPLCIADFLVISGTLSLAEKLFSKRSADDDAEQ